MASGREKTRCHSCKSVEDVSMVHKGHGRFSEVWGLLKGLEIHTNLHADTRTAVQSMVHNTRFMESSNSKFIARYYSLFTRHWSLLGMEQWYAAVDEAIVEDEEEPTKSSKKPPKTHAGVSVKVSSSGGTAPRHIIRAFANKNLFACIDAVARGTAETLQSTNEKVNVSDKVKAKKTVSEVPERKKDDTAQTYIIPTFANKNLFACIGPAVAKSTAEKLQNKVVLAPVSPAPGAVDNDAPSSFSTGWSVGNNEKVDVSEKVEVRKPVTITSDSESDDDIWITEPSSIIVIDSDSETEPTPLPPVSKTRRLKRPSTTMEEAHLVKIERSDDEDSVMVTRWSKEHLVSIYGLPGAPHHKQWKCPKCNRFKSKNVGDFIFHIYMEFNFYRYKCKACSDLSIPYKYMLDHIALHPGFNEDIIEVLVPNVKLETWIHMVVREQSLAIIKNSPVLKKKPLTGPTDIACYFCEENFMSMRDCCEHMLYHWVIMPYQCQCLHCPRHYPSGFYTVFELKHHHKIEHPDLQLNLDPKGPTITRVIQCIENIKKRSSVQCPSRDDSRDTNKTNEDVNVIQRGIVTNPKYKKGPKGSPNITSTSTADVIRIDDDDDDLVIVTKTESTTTPNEDEMFACDACAYLADTEVLIIQHLHDFHGIELANKFNILSKLRSEIPSDEDMTRNIGDVVLPELTLMRHFPDNRLECHTSKVKMHSGKRMNYQSVIKAPARKAMPKNRLYSCTMCSYTNICSNASEMRAHLRGHLPTIGCNHCHGRFRYYSEVQTHNTKEHSDLEPDFTTLKDVQREFMETLKEISSNCTPIKIDNEAIKKPKRLPVKVKKMLKSRRPHRLYRPHSPTKRRSKYSSPTDKVSFSNITTTFELDGQEYTTTTEQMMKMFNMDPFVNASVFQI